jgi:hypothetical protein
MMRPIVFFTLMVLVAREPLLSQDPVATAFRITEWTGAVKVDKNIGWSVFSRQYYCLSNWNASGLSVSYTSNAGQSSALVCRDGIPGYSWYHLYLSHYRHFKNISGMLQLRFSVIDLKDNRMVFRLGGNIRTGWSISQILLLQVSIYDFTGWILPSTAIARGDPAMEFLLFHEPGRLIGLAAGFQVSRSQFGPVRAAIRVNINDEIGVVGLFDVLPFGISLGINWKLKGYKVMGWLEHRTGVGSTPMMIISNH